ncbi:MAG: AIM24 family protein [Acidimicrobiales bacterium]
MTETDQRVECRWCHAQSPTASSSCTRCGAPLDVRNLVTDAGWRQAPKIRDLTEVTLGNSRFQLDGTVVPVAEAELAAGDSVYFEHHAMLWKDFSVAMTVMNTTGGVKRILAGMPFVVSVAHGPGRISLSRDAPGELVVVPLDPGREVDAREHALLVASGNVAYTFEKVQGLKAMLAAGTGMYLDRFSTQSGPGLVILHGYGNVLERNLGPGETVEVEPGGFLYKDAGVTMSIDTISLTPEGANQGMAAVKGFAGRGLGALKAARNLTKGGQGVGGLLSAGGMQAAAGLFTGPGITLMRLGGPGRVGIQSMYFHHETG